MGELSQRTYVVTVRIAVFGFLLTVCPSVFALNPSLNINQYAHTAWRSRDGFIGSEIYSIVQSPDGYLWLGTGLGLFRFDGVKPVPWQPPADQPLPSTTIMQLMVARDGKLWIGTDKGLVSWKDGKLTHYPELAGHYVFALLEDREGTVWVGTTSIPNGKLCSIQNDRVQFFGEDGSLGRAVLSLYEDRKGSLWVGVVSGLWRWKPGPPQFFALSSGPNAIRILGEDDDALLIRSSAGIQRFVDGRTEAYPLPDALRQSRPSKVLRDRDGGLWIGSYNDGLAHICKGKTDRYSSADGLSSDKVDSLFEDREGSIWVTTSNGIDRFRDFSVPSFQAKQGLSSTSFWSVLTLNDGSVLVATSNGVNQWSNGNITNYGGKLAPADQITQKPRSLFQDSRGRIWAVSQDFGYLEKNRFIPLKPVPGGIARSIVEDHAGNLWIANQDLGLFCLRGGEVIRQIPWTSLGRKDFAAALAIDPSRGGLWIGFFQGGLAYFNDGKVQEWYEVENGLGDGRVNDLRFDPDGTLWIATEKGLSRLKNRQFETLTMSNGLPCGTIHWLKEDDDRDLWMYTTCGLVRIARSDLDDWAAAVDQHISTKKIQATVFGISDGVTSIAYPSGLTPTVAKTADGRLWFPFGDGVSVIDPRHLAFNRLPPPVHIEQFIANHQTYNASERLQLPPLIRDLQIDYTALSLAAPEKVLFRYKLEPWDRDWQDAGNRRQAFYNNLSPGNYRFRVIACNNSGVWNEEGAFLDFSIAPAYYQTTWFRISTVAAFLVLVAAVYQLRVRQVARQLRVRMEERLNERERIARDLHDTLLQSVQGLILKIHAATKQTRDEAAREALEKALDQADQILGEGRDRVRNLRGASESHSDLPEAFKRVAEENPQAHETTFKAVVEGSQRELHPLVMEESYCIGREAIINALTHSNGSNVEVEITYDPRQFRLRVRDDGRGFDPKILEDGGRPDHWGLQGMRERSDRIGAQLKIWSRLEAGTEVELIVPGATAYRPGQRSRRFWFGRSSGADGNQL